MLQANQSHTANIRANEDLAQDDLAECGPVNDVSVVFDRSTVRKPPSIFLTIDPTIYADWFWWRRPLASPLRNVENGAARNAPFLLQCAINSTWVGSELKDSVSNCTRSGYPPSLSPSMVAFPKVTLGKGALGAWEDIIWSSQCSKEKPSATSIFETSLMVLDTNGLSGAGGSLSAKERAERAAARPR
jgi:hypothetical protein